MAETATLGKLVVQMLLDPAQFQAGMATVQAGAKALVSGLQRAAAQVNQTLQPALESAGESAKSLAGRLEGLGDVAGDALVTGFKAATAAATALVAASAYVGVGFEAQMKKVSTIAGGTSEDMGALTEEARRLGATTSYSATEAAQAMEVLASAGMKTPEIIAATGQAMTLAGAGGVDLATSASIVASTLSQYSLSAEQAGRVSDVLAKATADSQFTVNDLGEALKYGGPVAASFGLSLEETVAIMAQFRDLGLEGSMAGTALRSVFSQASQQTKTNADTLAKYNLELKDVNPNLRSFGDILATVGSVGMSASDAMVVFGVEAGGAVATLAQQAATGSTKLDEMTASLMEASGAASTMYADMQATVAGSFAELQSAAEEVLLTLYAQYGSALGALLDQITAVVNRVAEAVAARSDEIRGALGAALAILGNYLDEHGDDLAAMFAEGVAQVASFAVGLAKVLTDLAAILPVLDDIALTMGLVWVATKVAAFVSVLGEVVTLFGAARLGLRAFMVELTVASGGTYALVAAIGVLVAGLVALIGRYRDAKDAAEQLKAAQDALAGKRAQEDAARVAQLDALLERQRAALAAEEQALAASGQLTAAKKAELDILRDLTAESAARLEAEGKLVQVGDQLRTVASLVEDANTSASDAAVAGYEAIDQRVASLRAGAAETGRDIAALEKAISQAKAAATEDASDATLGRILTGALGEEIATITEAEARLEDLKSRRKEANQQAVALETERGKAVASILDREVQDQKDAESARLRAKGEAVASVMQTEREYVDETRDLRFKLQQELAALEGVLTDQIALEFADRRREIDQAYQDQQRKAKGNAAEIERLEREHQEALTDLAALEERKRATVAAEAEAQRAKKVADERERLLDHLTRLEREGATEVERLEQEKADALAGITGANVDLLLKIAEQYDRKIADARQRELDDAKAAADELAQQQRDNARKVAQQVVAAFASAAQAIGSAFGSIYGILESFASRVLSLFETLTGFSFDLAGLVEDVAGTVADAADEGTTLSASDAAGTAVADLFSEAGTLLKTFVEAAPVLIQGLVDGLPTLIDAFLAALPTLAAAALDAVPTLVGVIADALPGLVAVVVALLPDVVDALLAALDAALPALLDALPDLLGGFVEAASALVQGVLARLPDIVDGLLALLPDLIRGVLAELPTLIRALLAAATDVVVALVAALPDLIGALLEALPDILTALIEGLVEALPLLVEALVEAIPELILAVTRAVPDIVQAVVDQIPAIITALVDLIPVLILGIAEALPELIPAITGMSGEIVAALVLAIPDIATALVMSVVDLLGSLPELAAAIGQAFVDGIKGAAEAIWDALTSIFEGLWDWLSGGSDSGSSRSRTAAPSGTEMAGLGLAAALSAALSASAPTVEPVTRDTEDAGRRPPAGTTGQGSTARVQVVLNGRTIQEALAVSDARGETTIRSTRSSGNAPAGISRGRYNRYSK